MKPHGMHSWPGKNRVVVSATATQMLVILMFSAVIEISYLRFFES
jgi:hypothetical protein